MPHHLDQNYVFYRLTSTLFDHHDLTATTGIRPWSVCNIGDWNAPWSRFPYRVSSWRLRARDPEIPDLGLHLDLLFEHLEQAWPALCDYGTVYHASVWFQVGLRSNRPAPRFVLTPAHLQRIIELHANLDIDPYCLGQEDLKQANTLPIETRRDAIELNTATATYTLSGPNLDPTLITALTRLIPSHTMRSSPLSTDASEATTTHTEWKISARRVKVNHRFDPIQALIDELLPAWPVLRDLGREFTAAVAITSRRHCGEAGGGMSFAPSEIQRLVELNATLAIEFDCRYSDTLYIIDPSPPTT